MKYPVFALAVFLAALAPGCSGNDEEDQATQLKRAQDDADQARQETDELRESVCKMAEENHLRNKPDYCKDY